MTATARRRRGGWHITECVCGLAVIGAILAATGDLYLAGARLRTRYAAECWARARLADALAGDGEPARVEHEGFVAEIAIERRAAGPGLVELRAVAAWTAGEHRGEIERRRLERGPR